MTNFGREEPWATVRLLAAALAVAAALGLSAGPASAAADGDSVRAWFEQLSQNGNSNCSGEFMEAIANNTAPARLQGSCCAPMDEHRYGEQIAGLRAYAHIEAIPPDPYDVDSGSANRLMASYELELNEAEQVAYDYAMANSDEKGPCCCQCWRWYVYGGLGKLLIRDHGFDGEQLVDVWNLSSGCGGTEHHH